GLALAAAIVGAVLLLHLGEALFEEPNPFGVARSGGRGSRRLLRDGRRCAGEEDRRQEGGARGTPQGSDRSSRVDDILQRSVKADIRLDRGAAPRYRAW